jgi:gas vesicle protein
MAKSNKKLVKYNKTPKTPKTPKSGKGKRKTLRKHSQKVPNTQKSAIVKTFFEILHSIKLYHWKTQSYSQHKATDELHEKLSGQVDRFVEVLMGKTNSRIDMVEHKMRLYDFDTKFEFQHKLFEFRQFLIDLNDTFKSKKDSDLMTIRDDMLESVNQFLYLLTLR